MSDVKVFNFSSLGVAGAYERYLVPRIFGPWAETLVEALDVRPGESLLDIACGPGTVTKAAARRIGDGGIVVGTDVSPEMLDVARASTPAARVRYECASAESLPFGPAEFDAITVQQGMQFFADRPAAIAEMFRVLRPGGRAGMSVWVVDETPFFIIAREVLGKAVPEMAPALDRPLVDRATLQAELVAGGFEVASGTLSLPLEFDDIEQAVDAIQGLPMWPAAAAQPAPVRRAILEAARERFSAYLHHGHVQMAMRANVTVARKPPG